MREINRESGPRAPRSTRELHDQALQFKTHWTANSKPRSDTTLPSWLAGLARFRSRSRSLARSERPETPSLPRLVTLAATRKRFAQLDTNIC